MPLPALSGVRILLAVHIYLFHVKQAHDAGLLRFDCLAALPGPLANLMGRGHVSTGVFFELSGFLLAYAYLGEHGGLRGGSRGFWRGRFLRLYPLYLLSLLLLIPAPALLPFTARNPGVLETLGGVATSLTLTQAWFPTFALWWNAPAWALSAFAAFYAVFPLVGRWLAGRDRPELLRWAIGFGFLSWLPALGYLAIDPDGDAWTATSITLGGGWLTALRFNPLSWLPQFLAGAALGRWFAIGVDRGEIRPEEGRPWPSIGDAVAVGLLLFLATAVAVPYVPLRHGLLAPAVLVVLDDLARGRGLLARCLSLRPLGRLSEASFALFALQMPAGLWFCVAALTGPHGTTTQLIAMIVWTLGIAIGWAELVQRRLFRRGSQANGGDRPPSRAALCYHPVSSWNRSSSGLEVGRVDSGD